MELLEQLRRANPGLPLFDVRDPEFTPYGRVLDFETTALDAAMRATPLPETGNRYVASLPELEALYQKYKDAGVAVVGVLLDGAEGTGLKDGKALLEQAGVTYLNVLPTRALESLTSLMYVPTTVFLNEKGEMVGEAIVGADPDAYEARIKAMLP